MISPFMNGEQGQYAPPPPGLAALLQQRNQQTGADAQGLGKVAGDIGSAIVGMVQGFRNPGVFNGNAPDPNGSDTVPGGQDGGGTPAVGAGGPAKFTLGQKLMSMVKAGAINMASANGDGGGQAGLARLTNPDGASSTGAGMNFKQFAALGKMADATRNMMKESTPTLPGQDEQPVMGMTDDQWQHSGTGAKIQAFGAVKQANDLKQQKLGQMQTMAEIGKNNAQTGDINAQQKLREQQAGDEAATGNVLSNMPAKGSNPDGSYSQADYVNAMRGMNLPKDVQSRIFNRLLTMPKTADDGGGPITYSEDPVTGERVARLGKSLLPSGINPAKQAGGPGTLTEPQRQNLIMQHGAARTKLLDMAATLTSKGGAGTNMLSAIDAELGAHQSVIDKLTGKQPGASGQPAGSSAATPTRQDVTYLAAHPDVKGAFEGRFGKGSADKYLP